MSSSYNIWRKSFDVSMNKLREKPVNILQKLSLLTYFQEFPL